MVFVIAAYLLIYLTEFVFEVDVPKSFHEFVAKCGGSIVPSFVYLSRFKTPRASVNKFGEGIIKFVFTPLWAIYFFPKHLRFEDLDQLVFAKGNGCDTSFNCFYRFRI